MGLKKYALKKVLNYVRNAQKRLLNFKDSETTRDFGAFQPIQRISYKKCTETALASRPRNQPLL